MMGTCRSLPCRRYCYGPSTHHTLGRLGPRALLSLLEVVDSSLYCFSCHRVVTAMPAMVRVPGVPDSGDAYMMNTIAADVPMATLAMAAGVVAISNFIS